MPGSIGLLRDLKNRRWDVLHVHGYPNFMADWLTLSKKIHQVPLVITAHGSVHQFTSNTLRMLKEVHNAAMSRFLAEVDMFIAVSDAERTVLLGRGFPPDRVRVVRNGVSRAFLDSSRSDYLRETYGPGFYAVYIGRLSGSKNIELLPRLMELVRKRNPEVRLVVAGGDYGMRAELERQAAEAGVRDGLIILGWLAEDEKLKVLTSADVFVHPSLQDVASLGVMEAEACGTPAVAFDTPGNAEMILNNKTGILAPRDDPNGLADAILGLAEDEASLRRMGEAAREHMSTHFRWETTVRETARVYEELDGRVS